MIRYHWDIYCRGAQGAADRTGRAQNLVILNFTLRMLDDAELDAAGIDLSDVLFRAEPQKEHSR